MAKYCLKKKKTKPTFNNKLIGNKLLKPQNFTMSTNLLQLKVKY